MKHVLVYSAFISCSFCLHGQSVDRVEVNGVLYSNNNDVEAVTIFNKSSNKGTITNKKGEFTIKVALNDVIEISALQFQTMSITVDEGDIKANDLKIYLVEHINQLDAVTLSSGLSGNILVDVDNIKKVKPITIHMGNMNVDFEYNDDKAFDNEAIGNHLKSVIDPEARNYLPDAVKILELLFKKDLSIKMGVPKEREEKPQLKKLLDVYSHKDINQTFNISLEHVEAFVAFVEEKGIRPQYFIPENEIHLIEFLMQQRELFIKYQDVKN